MKRFDDVEDPRRRLLLLALGAGLLAPAAAAPLLGNVPHKLPAGRSIYRLDGSVLVNGKPATTETVIGPDATVETSEGGQVIFVVGQDAYNLRGGSKLVLGTQRVQSGVVRALNLLSGALLSVFGRAEHRLNTTTVTIGIRGTGVYAETDPELTYFCTCYGTVDLTAKQDPNSRETIESKHHDKPVYILGKPGGGKYIRPAPMKNHSDAELALIEELVGRTPPFVFPQDDYNAPRREY
jgi:hypothetical protein